MNLKTLITSALVLVATSTAAFAGPRAVEVDRRAPVHETVRVEDHRAPVRVVERTTAVRPEVRNTIHPIVYHPGYGHGRVVSVHPVWHPIIRPIVRPIYVGYDNFNTVGTFATAFDGSQDISLGDGQVINTLRIAGNANDEIFSVLVTYADGETQTIACNQFGSFETDLGGNVVTNLQINARTSASAPLQIQIA
jgi:hypothetical protein